MPAEVSQVHIGDEKRIKIDVPNVRFSANRVWRRKPDRITARNTAVRHRGAQFQFCFTPIRGQRSVEAADGLLTNAQVHNPDRTFPLWGAPWAGGLQSEGNLSANGQPGTLQFFKILQG